MKDRSTNPYRAHRPEAGEQRVSPLSRRNFLKGLGATAGVLALPKTASVVADFATVSDSELLAWRQRRNEVRSNRYEAEDRQQIKEMLELNKAVPIGEVATESGMLVKVMQAQTGWNQDVPIQVNAVALNNSLNFLIGSMGQINEANGRPIEPGYISTFQEKARQGKLSNVEMTVIVSATTGFHNLDGNEQSGGLAYNGHVHDGVDVRKNPLPLICIAPNIYAPGSEEVTRTPSAGLFPDQDTQALEKLMPTGSQYLTTHFAHETSHVLWDLVGTGPIEELADSDPNHYHVDYEHKLLVSPHNWYHTAALAGLVEGQPPLESSFVLPETF
ncbi:MAG: hypothetical protein QG553_608 [Patescibacteria group bacterium]|nr:hypothetical protein [Patescibacteria group bacterium]